MSSTVHRGYARNVKVKHEFTVVIYRVATMLEGWNVLAVLGKVRFIAITHDKRYCLQLDSCQKIASRKSYLTKKLRSRCLRLGDRNRTYHPWPSVGELPSSHSTAAVVRGKYTVISFVIVTSRAWPPWYGRARKIASLRGRHVSRGRDKSSETLVRTYWLYLHTISVFAAVHGM